MRNSRCNDINMQNGHKNNFIFEALWDTLCANTVKQPWYMWKWIDLHRWCTLVKFFISFAGRRHYAWWPCTGGVISDTIRNNSVPAGHCGWTPPYSNKVLEKWEEDRLSGTSKPIYWWNVLECMSKMSVLEKNSLPGCR